jgi:acetylornithine deacetylase/succinyl-diaminopimelate desuccinylase-like protein
VPARVAFRIDRRIIPEESPADAEDELRALIEDTAARIPGIRVELRRILLSLPLVKLAGAERMTQALQARGREFFGVDIAEHGVPLYTDARHYTAAGVPAVLYGAGPPTLDEANGHRADERLALADLHKATLVVALALADLLAA